MKEKLFTLSDTANSQQFNLATEMIAQQQNDYVVKVIEDIFEKIISNTKEFGLDTAKKVFTNRKNKPLIIDLDNVLSKRFGINYTHTFSTGSGYAVWTIPPKNQNILNKNIVEMSEAVDEYTKGQNDENTNTNSKNIHNADTQIKQIMYKWHKSMEALEKTMNTTGVRIDLEKAVIHGLPKEYEIFITCDLNIMINEIGLDAKELTAVLLHEIGHSFTHIEYSYRSMTNTSVLIDTINDSVNKNKSYKETLVLIYEDVLDGKRGDLDGANDITATIKIVDEYLKTSVGMIPTPHGGTDSEQLADQFSGRFGLGPELISGLNKMNKRFPEQSDFMINLVISIITATFSFVIGLLIAGGLSGGLFLALVSFTTVMVVGFLTSFFNSILTNGGVNDAKTYDNSKQRLVRIKNEMIRRIRTENVDKKIKVAILHELDDVTAIIANTPDPSLPVTDRLIRMVSSSSRRLANMKQIEQITENLMENDLHASALRINLLK